MPCKFSGNCLINHLCNNCETSSFFECYCIGVNTFSFFFCFSKFSVSTYCFNCLWQKADVTEDGAAERLVTETVSTLGGLDILINNAGGNSFSVPVASMRLSGWSKTMALNVDATVALIQQALPNLASSNHGVIINVGSVAGLRGAPMMSHYGAAKAAIASLTRSVALEAAHQGVRVNSLVPGWIDTDLTDFLRVDEGTESSVLSRVPLGRWGRSDEIAQAALFLASDASSFMTGQELIVDGGLSAMP